MGAKRQRDHIIKVWGGKSTRNFMSIKITFKFEGQIKIFTGKQKQRRYGFRRDLFLEESPLV